jgi:hypothetical protein
LINGLNSAVEVVNRVDQGKMRTGLREVAALPHCLRVIPLRKQTDVVAKRQKAFEQAAGIIHSALLRIGIDKPRAAGQKCSLTRQQAVFRLFNTVSQNEALPDETSLNGGDGSPE